MVSENGGGPSNIQEAKSWGSHKSPLIAVLRDGHKDHRDVRLSSLELEKIITWVDLNAPYYPTYESAFPAGLAGRSPLTGQEVKTLGALTGVKFVTGHGPGKRAQLSFDRPELSPCCCLLG